MHAPNWQEPPYLVRRHALLARFKVVQTQLARRIGGAKLDAKQREAQRGDAVAVSGAVSKQRLHLPVLPERDGAVAAAGQVCRKKVVGSRSVRIDPPTLRNRPDGKRSRTERHGGMRLHRERTEMPAQLLHAHKDKNVGSARLPESRLHKQDRTYKAAVVASPCPPHHVAAYPRSTSETSGSETEARTL